ncbi:MAG: hypothetical protein MUF87_01310 [Anaerolineae bacterium]|nr:hypothetical protein [Anaerolineae bacterium]
MSQFSRRDLFLLVLAAGLVALYVVSANGGFPLDDSWIHQVYGRNLAFTGQWAFIPGEPSAASTSPLYTVLLAIGYGLRLPYALWTHALGAIALAGAGIFSAHLADRLLPNRDRIGLLTGVGVVMTWQLIWAASSGMETILFGALCLGLIAVTWRELDAHNYLLTALNTRAMWIRGLQFGAIAALTTLARPEGILLVGICGIALLIARDRQVIFWIIGAMIAFGVMIAPYLALNLSLTGGLLPNTAAAKQIQHEPLLMQSYPVRLFQMTVPLFIGGQFLLIFGLVAMSVSIVRKHHPRLWLLYHLPLVWVIALIALYAARLPAAYQHGRYVLPALPALVVFGIVGTVILVQRGRIRRVQRVLTGALATSVMLLWVFFAFSTGLLTYVRDVSVIDEEMVNAAFWIRDHLPPDELLAIHDIGAVGYFAPRPMLDIAGLLSPEVIPLIHQPEAMWAWLEANEARYLMAFPDQIPGDDPSDPRLCRVYVTGGAAQAIVGYNMTIYRLAWDRQC